MEEWIKYAGICSHSWRLPFHQGWLKIIKVPLYLFRNILCIYGIFLCLFFILKHKCHLSHCATSCLFLIISWRLVHINARKGCLIHFSSCLIFHCLDVVRTNGETMNRHERLLSVPSSVLFQVICTFHCFWAAYSSVNCRKLIVMQMILVCRNTNDLSSGMQLNAFLGILTSFASICKAIPDSLCAYMCVPWCLLWTNYNIILDASLINEINKIFGMFYVCMCHDFTF